MNTTIRNRLFSALVILLGSFVSGVMIWALTQPAPHAWLWWALLPSTCFLCFFTMLFAGRPEGILFVADGYRGNTRK
jgi:hypothetical protein